MNNPVEAIRSLVQSLIVIIVLAVFLEMFLPAGEMRKYVKMVMGLLIIIAVVQAVGDLARFDFTGELQLFAQKEDDTRFSDIMKAGEKITGDQQQKAVEQYRYGLANQVMALAQINKSVPVVDVNVEVQSERNEPNFGQLKEIILVVARHPEPGGEKVDKGAGVGVEPVMVQVGTSETDDSAEANRADNETELSEEAVASLIKTVSGFYNLKPEQVKVVYR